MGDLGVGESPAWPSFGAGRRHELKGAAATAAAVLAELPRWAYLGFYCHGGWEPGSGDDTALVLAGGERLTARELRRLDLPRSRLAFLAACETGLIDINELPDEFVGLPAGLLQAGVPGVVASLWPVSAEATRELAREFFALHLDAEQPLSPAQALRQAQLDLLQGRSRLGTVKVRAPVLRRVMAILRGDPVAEDEEPVPQAFDQPFYWAAFSLVGA